MENPIHYSQGIRRLAIIGVGAVGSAFAYALVQAGRPREIVLIDHDRRLAEGQVMDLSHCLPYGRPVKLEVGDLDTAADCDLVVITAGAAQRPGESRIDLVKRNAEIMGGFFPRLSKANPKGLFVLITNPVDVMTRLAVKLSGLSPEQVFGTGTTLDTARFRQLLSQHLSVDPRNVHAYVVGEHGDSEVLLWSNATVGPYPVEEYARRVGAPIDAAVKAAIETGVRRAAYEIIERKGMTNFAIGIATQRIFESLSSNQSTLQTVSRQLGNAYGLGDVCMALPCLLRRSGASEPMEMHLTPEEHTALMASAEKLDGVYRALGA